MTVKLWFQLGTSIILLLSAARATVQLAHRRSDLGLRVLVPALWMLSCAATAGIPDLFVPLLKRLLGVTFTALAVNGAVIAAGYLLAMFFLVVKPDTSPGARRCGLAVGSSLLVTIAAVWATTFTVATPGWLDRQPHTYSEYRNDIAFAIFNLSGDVGAVGFWIIAACLGIRLARDVGQQWAKWGLLLVSAGAATLALGTFSVALLIDLLHIILPSSPARFRALGNLYISALVIGQGVVAIGLAFPALADFAFACRAVVVRCRTRRYKRPVLALWRLVSEEFPFITLPDHPSRGLSLDRPMVPALGRGALGDIGRVIGEVIDGLSWLAPYYAAGGLDVLTDRLGEDSYEGVVKGLYDAESAARVVNAALRARAADMARGAQEAVTEPPYPRLLPEFQRWDELVRWLADLSDALAALGVMPRQVGQPADRW